MFSNLLSSIEDVSVYPVITLILFVFAFVLVVIRLVFMDKETVDEMKNIPLEDDNEEFITNNENKNEKTQNI